MMTANTDAIRDAAHQYFQTAETCDKQGDYETAVENYTQAVSVLMGLEKQTHADLYFIANLHLALGYCINQAPQSQTHHHYDVALAALAQIQPPEAMTSIQMSRAYTSKFTLEIQRHRGINDKARTYFEKAIQALHSVPEAEQNAFYWECYAKTHNNFISKKNAWIKKAAAYLYTCKENAAHAWLEIAFYMNSWITNENTDGEKEKIYKDILALLHAMQAKDQPACLPEIARYHFELAMVQKGEDKLKSQANALRFMQMVPEAKRNAIDSYYSLLGYYQSKAALNVSLESKKALTLGLAALDSFLQPGAMKLAYVPIVKSLYERLMQFFFKDSIEYHVMSFAKDIFTPGNRLLIENFNRAPAFWGGFKEECARLAIAAQHTNQLQSPIFIRSLAQLLRLISTCCTAKFEINAYVQSYVEANINDFGELVANVTQMTKPALSLLQAVDAAPNFSVAVADRLTTQQNMINDLMTVVQQQQERITVLEQKLNQLAAEQSEKQTEVGVVSAIPFFHGKR